MRYDYLNSYFERFRIGQLDTSFNNNINRMISIKRSFRQTAWRPSWIFICCTKTFKGFCFFLAGPGPTDGSVSWAVYDDTQKRIDGRPFYSRIYAGRNHYRRMCFRGAATPPADFSAVGQFFFHVPG